MNIIACLLLVAAIAIPVAIMLFVHCRNDGGKENLFDEVEKSLDVFSTWYVPTVKVFTNMAIKNSDNVRELRKTNATLQNENRALRDRVTILEAACSEQLKKWRAK